MNEKLEEMWTALSAHQPTADRLGYGVEWSRMCSERTPETAALAANAVWHTAGADKFNYAAYAADAARDVACAVRYSITAIDYITKAKRDDLLDTYITSEGRARAIEQALKEKNT